MKHKEFQVDLQDFGIVIPTLGERTDYLASTIESLPKPSSGFSLVLVAPETAFKEIDAIGKGHKIKFVVDPGQGLARAINLAIASLPETCRFVTWIGDDDSLIVENLKFSLRELREDHNIVATFGDIELIDEVGNVFTRFRTSQKAATSIFFGPNRVPQPGSILRRSAFEQIGSLDPKYKFSFDSDMFMRLSKLGTLKYIPHYVAKFRWHSGSLSAGQSANSIREASAARLQNLPRSVSRIAWVWEKLHIQLALSRNSNSFDRRLRKANSSGSN
jgi:hypothetical protein